MNEETVIALTAAINRFAAALERVTGPAGGMLGAGGSQTLNVYHHNAPSYPQYGANTWGSQNTGSPPMTNGVCRS